MSQPPHNIEAEQALLGALMLDESSIHRIASMVESSDFYWAKHAVLFDAIKELSKEGKPPDMVVLTEKLKADGKLKMIGDASYLVELTQQTPTSANITHYASMIAEKSRARKIIALADKAKDQIMRGHSPDEVMNFITESVSNGTQPRGLLADNEEATREALDNIASLEKGKKIGYSFGISRLNDLLLGIRPGLFYILAARPGMGKTTFADQILNDIPEPCAMILIEGRASQILEKRIYRETGFDQYDILEGHANWDDIIKASERVSRTSTMLFKAKTLNEVISSIYQAVGKGAKVIVIDYLQLIDEPASRTIREKVIKISSALSEQPGKHNISLILLAQLSRLHESEGRKPELRDLQESSAIEQSADVVMFIYSLRKKKDEESEPETYIIVSKHRFGKVGAVRIVFNKRRQSFEPYYGEVSE